jgi:hypothetical protein
MSGDGRSVHPLSDRASRLFGTSGLRRMAAVRMPVDFMHCASQGSFRQPEQSIECRINRPPEVTRLRQQGLSVDSPPSVPIPAVALSFGRAG